MSSNDVAISPESLSTYLTITGKHLPFSLLVVYVANPSQRVSSSSSFRSPVTWFAIAPGSICCFHAATSVFVHYSKISKNVPEEFSSVIYMAQRELEFNWETRNKQFSFHNVLVKFAVTEHAPNLVNFFFVVQHSHIPHALRCRYVFWYHFFFRVQYWNCFHIQHITQNLHFSGISQGIEFVKPRIVEFHIIFLVLWRNLHGTGHCFCNLSILFTVPILLGNIWKIRCRLGVMDIEQKIWKS